MDQEQPHQELVKCVVVGDTAVGKTRLICARACNKHVSLSQLLTTHVPTVWAIDQYRIYKDVLERSWEMVDGVNVSLRLWDTFGDHDKDRRFAYGRSDVVLLCFSVTSPMSLRNCAAMWYPEIRKFCPNTPVLLVGCKNDLRHMYRDETYLSFFRDHSPFVRATRKSDLVMPDEGRALARELGLYYYESSVLTSYGVNEVFENAIRAALLARRQQRFWMTNLKRVQRPLLQAPFLPPAPPEPAVTVAASTYLDNLATLLAQGTCADLLLVCGERAFPAHRLMLAAASGAFLRLLTLDLTPPHADLARSSSESSVVSSAGELNEDTERLIRREHSRHSTPRTRDGIERRSSCQLLPTSAPGAQLGRSGGACDLHRDVDHPAIRSIRVPDAESRSGGRTVVTMSELVTPRAMLQLLNFVYSGLIDNAAFSQSAPIGLLLELRQAAELLALPELVELLAAVQVQHQLLDADSMRHYRAPLAARLGGVCAERALFADVTFELEDGRRAAQRALLAARCDPMRAMLQGQFRESTARLISLPGVDMFTFRTLMVYVSTDAVPDVSAADTELCLGVLELANRFCMPRLLNLMEARIVEALRCADPEPATVRAMSLLEPAKLHNAHALADWCTWRLCGAYDVVCRARQLRRRLHSDNRDYLSEHRYPPVWYLKEFDYYTRCCTEREREARSAGGGGSGATPAPTPPHHLSCLCFSSKARRESDSTPDSGGGEGAADALLPHSPAVAL